MRMHDKIYTFMMGSLAENAYSESYGVVDNSDDNGIPAMMFIENNGMRIENENLYHMSEEILRKAIKRGMRADKSVCFLAELAYDENLSLSKMNSSLIFAVKPFSDIYKSRLKDGNTNKTVDEILSEHYIDNIYVLEDHNITIHGPRNVICIEFNSKIQTLGDLDSNIPEDTPYMDNLIDFLKVVKSSMIF